MKEEEEEEGVEDEANTVATSVEDEVIKRTPVVVETV